MAESHSSENIHLISKGLYRLVCNEIGAENVVHARQQAFIFLDLFLNCETSLQFETVYSGSVAEGYDFRSSDCDFMMVNTNVLVLPNIFLFALFANSRQTVLLMETDYVAPGFALLRCLQSNCNTEIIFESLTQRGCNFYVNSKFVREKFLAGFNRDVHGPCQTGVINKVEFDFAHTLKCPFWPDKAKSFVSRSKNCGWPQNDVLKNICGDGCLFVAINSKQRRVNDDTDLEWRISFSHAERKLIHSMNHCQFLCYGLFKLFSKEVLKKCPSGDLLCSYFLKTALFWEICENSKGWVPENFMLKFWNVFRRIIKWVASGYCPNYFIPENNMFYGKIYGEEQTRLLRLLQSLHADGYRCLLQCASLNRRLTNIIQVPLLMKFAPDVDKYFVPVDHVELYNVKTVCQITNGGLEKCTKLLKVLMKMLHLSSTTEKLLFQAVKFQINRILQQMAEVYILYPKIAGCHISNKAQYMNAMTGRSILRRTRSSLCYHQIIYAKCMYMNGNYHEAIDMVNFAKSKLESQMFMYTWNLRNIPIIEELQRMSYNEFISRFIMTEYIMPVFSFMDELSLESIRDPLRNRRSGIFIPPLVFLDLILILSYTKLKEKERRKDVLGELERLVLKEENEHIDSWEKCVSWNILGMCQQVCGDYRGAHQSYMNSMHVTDCYVIDAAQIRTISLLPREKQNQIFQQVYSMTGLDMSPYMKECHLAE